MQLDTLIIGATFSGVGYALQSGENVLIVEKSGLIGSEFVDSLNQRKPKKIKVTSPMGENYLGELQARNLINGEGDIYAAPSMLVLCDLLRKSEKPVLFLTEIMGIEKVSNGFSVTLFNVDGYSVVNAKKIIDTTSAGVLHHSIFKVQTKKYLNAIIYGDIASFDAPVLTNSISGISVIRFPVDIGEGWQKAREGLVDYFKKNRDPSSNLRISLIASTFAYDMEENTAVVVEENFWWLPSVRYYNLLEAFDRSSSLLKEVVSL